MKKIIKKILGWVEFGGGRRSYLSGEMVMPKAKRVKDYANEWPEPLPSNYPKLNRVPMHSLMPTKISVPMPPVRTPRKEETIKPVTLEDVEKIVDRKISERHKATVKAPNEC